MDGPRKIAILLLLAAAVPATAQTFGFSLGLPARSACLSIGAATYRVSANTAKPDYTVRIGPNEPSPDVRVHLAPVADEADFVLVDDGAAPRCDARAGSTKTVKVSADATAPDLVVGLAAAAVADYRLYVRSERLSPQAVAALFALARRLPGHAVAGR